VGKIVLDLLSVEYQETIMAPSGLRAEKSLEEAIAPGGHILVVEGSIPLGDGGTYCTIGGRTALDNLQRASAQAAAVIAVGDCACFGNIPAANPNPTDAKGVRDVISSVPIINIAGCSMNVDNFTATIVHYLTFGSLPSTDSLLRPLFGFGKRIHDHCERRAHFDAGQYVEQWGDEGHRLGWCLYKMGCKGPETYHNCPDQRWNGGTSWPIGASHGCIGCSEPKFWDTMTPFYRRLPSVPGFGVESTADRIGLGLTAVTAAGIAVHAVASAARSRITNNEQTAEIATGEEKGGNDHGQDLH
jgi:hydrogenase small subunit